MISNFTFQCVCCGDFKQHSRGNPQFSANQVPSKKSAYGSQGLAEACKFVYNDAKFVNERAQSDILLLSRYTLLLETITIFVLLNLLLDKSKLFFA